MKIFTNDGRVYIIQLSDVNCVIEILKEKSWIQ